MIEDGLFLGLGFCAALLLALTCLPLLWARALRLTRQRMALLVPSSQAEVDAIHDGLRAQAAVVQRRLEQRIEAEQSAWALTRTELGHRTVALAAAEKAGEVLRGERADLIAELGVAARDIRDSEGQRGALEKALHDADTRVETAAVQAAEAALRHDRLSEMAEERRGAIAALETRAAGLLAKLEDAQEDNTRLRAETAGRASAEAALAAELAGVRSTSEQLRGELETARQEQARDREHAGERERQLQQRSDALAAAEVRMTEQDGLIRQGHEQFAALKQRFEALEAELRARDDKPSDLHEAARADALLRSAIIAVGDDALRLLKPVSEQQSAPHEDVVQAGE